MKKRVAWLLIMGFACISCTQKRQYFPKHMEQQEIEIVRFDEQVMNVRQESAPEDIHALMQQYSEFMAVWMEDILGISREDTSYLAEALPLFLEDTLYGFKATNALVKERFANIDTIQQELNEAFTRIHYLYEDKELPTIYFFLSGFNASIFFFENHIAVGVDMYLGSDYEWYNRVVYEYQKQTMRKECIAIDVVSAYLFHEFPFTSDKNRLLENMIYRGKLMYFLSVLFPHVPQWEIMGYTQTQWEWCEKYEQAIWNRIMDRRDLFKTESVTLTSYLNDGPFTAEISQDAPARLGTWIGWRIAESYMEHNQDVTMQELIEDGNGQKILEQSFYRP